MKQQTAQDVKTVMDGVISAMREGRNKSMQHRKAIIQKEFMIARRWVEDAYRNFPPEDLPIDMHRVKRDLAVLRDDLVDESCNEVDQEYRVATGILQLVADKNPGVYLTCSSGIRQPKAWRRPLPNVSATKISRLIPLSVLEHLNTLVLVGIIDEFCSGGCISFNHLTRKLDFQTSPPKRFALKKFLDFLKENGHLVVEGTGKGQKMKGSPTLETFRKALCTRSETPLE